MDVVLSYKDSIYELNFLFSWKKMFKNVFYNCIDGWLHCYRWLLRQFMLLYKRLCILFFCTRWSDLVGKETSSCISTTSYSCALHTSQCTGWWLLHWLRAIRLLQLLCPSSWAFGTCSLVSLSLGRYVTPNQIFSFIAMHIAY